MQIIHKFLLSMKRICITLATIATLAVASQTASADIKGNGYYRVQNYGTQRWASLVDDKGSVDVNANSADLHSLKLNKNTTEILSDPGSIIYVESLGGSEYNLAAQGTSLQSLVGYSINLKADGSANGQALYRAYGTYKGYTKYIADGNLVTSQDLGEATINISNANADNAKWFVIPVETNSDNFFGPVPTMTVGGKLYNPLFTSFAYTLSSPGMKAYYIGRVGFGMAEMIEITNGVPAGSGVIIECAGETAQENRVELVTNETALPNNSLRGVYFNYNRFGQTNLTAYNPKTMRILGQCSDGSLGYITADLDYIPANTSYLVVPEGSAPELKCVSTAEYEANLPETPEAIFMVGSMNDWDFSNGSLALFPQDEYNFAGTFLLPNAEGNGNVEFRFITELGEENSSLGAYSNGDVTISTSTGNYIGTFLPGSNYNWIIPSWAGAEVSVSLNLQSQAFSLNFDPAGVESIESLKGAFKYAGGIITTDGKPGIVVTNLAGQTVAKSAGSTLDINGLAKGVYVITSNGKSAKIVK